MLLEVAVNGARAPGEHPALPMTPDALAEAIRAARGAGAGAAHLHVRGADGRESLAGRDVAATLESVRAACGSLPLGLSTGAWIVPDPAERVAAVRAWRTRPDFASVNFDEAGAEDVARALLSAGVGVEAGLSGAAAALRLVASGLATGCLRVLLEPQESRLTAARECVAAAEAVLDAVGITLPRLLHGVGPTTWPLFAEAVARGYDGRIGLEDTLSLPDGLPARDNADLVAAARALAEHSSGGAAVRR